ncbi:MexH family multidrug efflux RND transporter periplasmic adaptor subunit [Pseudoalteromonas ruthenica]|uniref:MexH family multidrug efflux RND transporter periplasmic adaptor subunit n=1 Tax=Pseudoalteromonas ruthenica TaxID=151081 RepID=A0A5S3Z9R3_9GAMM|nr:efflux RND transporter periplasmic adaptor subunit [Pseudoalteromonas ruthenica]TMP88943.1 MexH family multidrug efflux RND transporter periplasmic adaptor subunit [Pseudoalteromonas ruthenica]
MNHSRHSGKALFPVIIIIFLGLCIYLYLPKGQSQQPNMGAQSTRVQAHTVTKDSRAITVDGIGSARANQAVYIKSAQSDYIDSIHFDDGDKVQAGQRLVQLRDTEEQLRVKELQANLSEVERQLNRLTELARSQATAKSLLEEQLAKFEATQAQLEAAKTKLAEMRVTAPFSGVLGKRMVSKGAFVSTNTEITTLDDISVIKVDFNVPEKYLAQLGVGMTVTARSDAYPNKLFTGKVSHVSSRIDTNTRSVPISASFTNEDNILRPGMLLGTQLELQTYEALLVPEKAIIPRQNKHFVFQIVEGVAKEVEVKIDKRYNGWVGISEGLSSGDQVVTEGIIKLRSGSAVTVEEAAL